MAEIAAALGDAVRQHEPAMAEEIARRQGRGQEPRDVESHLAALADAMDAGDPTLFAAHAVWAEVMLGARGLAPGELTQCLELARAVVVGRLAAVPGAMADDYLAAALASLASLPQELRSCVSADAPHGALARSFLDALLDGDRHRASRMVLDAVDAGVSVRDIYQHVFQPSQYEVGRLWQLNEISVAQEHYCTAATQLVMSQLSSWVFASEKTAGTLVATCVSGDLHEIGLRMVTDFLEMDGWNTFYLGANMPLQSVVDTVVERRAHVLCVSATMSCHLREVAELLALARARPECRDLRIVVGGHPFNTSPLLWQRMGAGGTARSAQDTAPLVQRLVRLDS